MHWSIFYGRDWVDDLRPYTVLFCSPDFKSEHERINRGGFFIVHEGDFEHIAGFFHFTVDLRFNLILHLILPIFVLVEIFDA